MKKFCIFLLVGYQKTLSFEHGFLGRITGIRVCRFYPSCSEYTKQAIEKYGSIQGIWMGMKRLSRCHPFCEGGYDPIEDQRKERRGKK